MCTLRRLRRPQEQLHSTAAAAAALLVAPSVVNYSTAAAVVNYSTALSSGAIFLNFLEVAWGPTMGDLASVAAPILD